jgi:hypothetical protein
MKEGKAMNFTVSIPENGIDFLEKCRVLTNFTEIRRRHVI